MQRSQRAESRGRRYDNPRSLQRAILNSVFCQMRDACHCTTPAHPAPYLPNPAGDGHPWQAPRSHSYLGWQPQGTSGMYLPRDVTMAACPSGGAVVAVADSAGSRLPASTGSYPIRQKSNDIFGPFGPQGTSISLYDGAAPMYVTASLRSISTALIVTCSLQVSDSYGPQSTGVARIVGYPVQGPNLPSWNPGMLVDSPSMVIQPSFGGMYDFGYVKENPHWLLSQSSGQLDFPLPFTIPSTTAQGPGPSPLRLRRIILIPTSPGRPNSSLSRLISSLLPT